MRPNRRASRELGGIKPNLASVLVRRSAARASPSCTTIPSSRASPRITDAAMRKRSASCLAVRACVGRGAGLQGHADARAAGMPFQCSISAPTIVALPTLATTSVSLPLLRQPSPAIEAIAVTPAARATRRRIAMQRKYLAGTCSGRVFPTVCPTASVSRRTTRARLRVSATAVDELLPRPRPSGVPALGHGVLRSTMRSRSPDPLVGRR